MCYSKLILSIIALCCLSNVCYAENWVETFNGNKRILLDTDSVNSHNDSIYYNVRYYDNNAGQDIIATIQSKDDKAGIVSTCKFSQYNSNKNLANSLTPKVATNFKTLNTTSLLFNANATAIEIDEQNKPPKENKSTVDYKPYMRDLQKRLKRNWQPPKSDITNKVVVTFKIATDGSMSDCKIFKTSGDLQTDNAALNAVKNTLFRPLPYGAEESVNIRFTFDYNVYTW